MQNKIQNKINKADIKTLERMGYIYNVFNNREVPNNWVTQEERIQLVGEINIHQYVNQVLLKI